MLAFENLSFLAGLLPLAAIPWFIHALHRKFPRSIRFPSIAYIRKSLHARSRLLRMRHIILLILRTLVVAMIIVAFLNPFLDLFASRYSERANHYVIIVLDHSLSMEYRAEALSPAKRALLEIDKVIENLSEGVQLNIIIAENQPHLCFPSFTTDHGLALAYTSNLKTGLSKANIGKATELAVYHLGKVDGARDIYYVSDFQRKNWANVDLAKLPWNTRIFFVDTSSSVKSNRAILKARVERTPVLAGEDVPIEITIGNFSDKHREERLELLLDDSNIFYQDFSLEPWSIKRVNMKVHAVEPGIHTAKITIPEDSLRYDNDYFLTFSILDKEEVVIVTDSAEQKHAAAFFITTAINPFPGLAGPLLPKVVNSGEISPAHLAACSKILITGVQRLSDETCLLLANFVKRGGGLMYFLDGSFDRENLALLDSLLENTLPWKIASLQKTENIPGGVQKIWQGDFRSKFLLLFSKSIRKSLTAMEFYQYYYTIPTGKGEILLRYADNSPAMASANAQLGTILLCNFSVGELDSNLARQKIFPAWIQHMVKNLGQLQSFQEDQYVGETFRGEVWKSELQNNYFVSPTGEKVDIATEKVSEDRLSVHFKTQEQGIYSLKSGGKVCYARAFNCDPEEADLRQIDVSSLSARTPQQRAYSLQNEQEFIRKGKPIFHYFVLAALFLLLVETFLFKVFVR